MRPGAVLSTSFLAYTVDMPLTAVAGITAAIRGMMCVLGLVICEMELIDGTCDFTCSSNKQRPENEKLSSH